MVFNKAIQYAITILQEVKNKSEPVRLQDIAKGNDISLAFLEQVSRKLRVAGYIESLRGPGGGYKATAKTANLAELSEIFGPNKNDTLPKAAPFYKKVESAFSNIQI